MHAYLFLRVMLALATVSQARAECEERKRMKVTHYHLDAVKRELGMLRDVLVEIGCMHKPSNNYEKSNNIEQTAIPDTTTITTVSTTRSSSSDDICSFTPVNSGTKKNITCFLSDVDIEKGLNLEKLVGSKLCTNIIMLVKHTYTDVPSGKSTFQYQNTARESANVEKWRSMNLKIYMQIGSWDDEKRLSGAQFSRFFDMPKARDRLATALANRLQQNNFDGLLISWYYLGCLRDACMGGEFKDIANSALFFKKLSELTKEKAIKAKIAVEVSIQLISILVFKINDIVKHIDLLLFENTSPENRVEVMYYSTQNMLQQFGTLDSTSNSTAKALAFNPKIIRGNVLMELETITAYGSYSDYPNGERRWGFKNITAKNLCKVVLASYDYEVTIKNEYKWPLNIIDQSSNKYAINDYDYVKARVDEYVNKLSLGGVWIRDLWADDMDNECNCGAFPILRAANEAVGRSACTLPNCPTSIKQKG